MTQTADPLPPVLRLSTAIGTRAWAIAGAGGRLDPLRGLALSLLFATGVVGLVAAAGTFHDGQIDPKTGGLDGPLTALWAGVVGTAEVGLGTVLLASLRPLALHRRRRSALLSWQAFLGLAVLATRNHRAVR